MMIRPTGFLSTVTIRDVDEQRRKSPNHVHAPRPKQAMVALVSPAMARARLLAGVTVAAYLVPQVMGYAAIAG